MIIPCIDLMGGKVVQLVRGEKMALEGPSPEEMLRRFSVFPEIQVIDLDAAMGTGSNEEIVHMLVAEAKCRVGGGIRSVERAVQLARRGAHKLIVGTAAFNSAGLNEPFLDELVRAVGREKILVALDSRNGQIVVRGWRQSTGISPEQVIARLEPYCSGFLCTFVDKEGMLQGTNLDWFRRLRAATDLELTAAGGITTLEEIRELHRMGVHAALGMAVYTGLLPIDELARVQASEMA